ncbi:unnamed protein product [Diatraea saccharalis]|uniref:Uncharacterized protein n=1 Tax=Diatraea saccharalis TaxID=40085 RepID=A0A9N9N3F3_9NEOP|nr:unnamed protein product [Diatraea saccharalis]
MILKALITICLIFVYEVHSLYHDRVDIIDDSDTTTVKIDQQTVEVLATVPPTDTDPVIERSSHYQHLDPTYHGFWKKKFVWRPRWVKTWNEKKIYVAVWKKMWAPAMLKEWVPVPKPPPGWLKHGLGHAHQTFYVKAHPH